MCCHGLLGLYGLHAFYKCETNMKRFFLVILVYCIGLFAFFIMAGVAPVFESTYFTHILTPRYHQTKVPLFLPVSCMLFSVL